MMLNGPVLLADFGDVISLVVFLLFFVIVPILTKLRGAGQAANKQKPRRPPQAGPPPRAAGHEPAGRERLTREIDVFLRRAAERRGAGPAKDIEIMEPEPVAAVRRLAPQVAEAEIVQAEPVLGGGVSAHVNEHIKAGVFDKRSANMAADVGQADERLEGHLHQVFEHRLGKLVDTTRAEHKVPDSIQDGTDADVWDDVGDDKRRQAASFEIAAQIKSMMQDPKSVREAIILSEILKRPDERF